MIIVDSREQKPIWKFASPNILRVKLSEGDYTTSELIGKAHIERKSGIDLYGSIIQGHSRFRDELKRALDKNIKLAIFVECSKEAFIKKSFKGGYRLNTPPSVLRKIVNTISKKYSVEFVWCNGRKELKEQALLWFDKEKRNV